MALNETNAQYYSGQQVVNVTVASDTLTFDFDSPLVSAFDTAGNQVSSFSNFEIFHLTTANPTPSPTNKIAETDLSIVDPDGKVIRRISTNFATGNYLCQLKSFAVQNNYGGYAYISLEDIISNFLVGYVGQGKIIQGVKRTDVLFHARRGLQEFSYDTLKVVKSQELTIPPSLTLQLPQDYVNYVQCSWIDNSGAKHIIYPTRVTSNPTELPIQDNNGIPTQDAFGENNEAQQSLTEERWKELDNSSDIVPDDYRYPRDAWFLGQRYGIEPEEANVNGKFTINERLGSFSFSSDLAGKLIIFEYISDGLAADEDSQIPKLAEQAMYMHIAHAILSTRANVPEYIVQRYKKDRFAALRNAKIRLSNIKTQEIAQVMRNKSKWIKH